MKHLKNRGKEVLFGIIVLLCCTKNRYSSTGIDIFFKIGRGTNRNFSGNEF